MEDLTPFETIAVTIFCIGLAIMALGGLQLTLMRRRGLSELRPARAVVRMLAVEEAPDKPGRLRIRVAADYAVDGVDYVCTRFTPRLKRYTPAGARKALGNIVPGATIRVWYDGNRPEFAAVRPQSGPFPRWYQFVLMAGGGAVALGGVLYYIATF